jgi:Membrane proteins related to metalloendopeptidases
MTYMDPFPKGTRISQEFRSSPGGFNPRGGHTGRDYAVPVGTPVRAAADGIIRNSSWLSDNYAANPWWLTRYGGDTLVLDCTDAFGRTETMPTFVYAHLSDSTAPVGARVKKGQIIGLSGNSGTATTGAHCHVERLNPNFDLHNDVYGRSPLNFDEYFLESNGIAAMGEATTPAPVSKEDFMGKLIITQPKGDKNVYIGDGVWYHRIPDVKTLEDYRKLAGWGVYDIFKNGETQDVPLAVLGKDQDKLEISAVQAESIAKRSAALVTK